MVGWFFCRKVGWRLLATGRRPFLCGHRFFDVLCLISCADAVIGLGQLPVFDAVSIGRARVRIVRHAASPPARVQLPSEALKVAQISTAKPFRGFRVWPNTGRHAL